MGQNTSEPPPTLDIGAAVVRPITFAEARDVIEQYEWLKSMPAVVRFAYGIFFDGRLGGAVIYGDEPGENLGIWDRLGYSGAIIALSRGACAYWTHPHSASKLIRASMKKLPAKYKVITATVDGSAGEIGTIYQACGFDYVGVMSAGGRALIRVNGKVVSERQGRSPRRHARRSGARADRLRCVCHAPPRQILRVSRIARRAKAASGRDCGSVRPYPSR